MGTFLDIEGDADEVSAKGTILLTVAESFRTKARAVLASVEAVEAERPWGTDEYGQGFEATYGSVPEGGDRSLRESVQHGMAHAGDRLTRVGDRAVQAMTEYQGVDADNEAEIRRTTG